MDWLQSIIEDVWWIIGGVVVGLIVIVLVALAFRWCIHCRENERQNNREIAAAEAFIISQQGHLEDPRYAFPWYQSMVRFFRGLPDRVRALFAYLGREDPRTRAMREENWRLNETIREERARHLGAYERIRRSAEEKDRIERELYDVKGEHSVFKTTSSTEINRLKLEIIDLKRELTAKNKEIQQLLGERNHEVVNEEEPGPSNRLEPFVEAPVQERPAGSPQDTDESDQGTENKMLMGARNNQLVNEEDPGSSAGPSNRLDEEEAPVQERSAGSPQESVEFDSGSENQRQMDTESSAGPSNRLVKPESVSPQESVEFDSGSENQRLMSASSHEESSAGPSTRSESESLRDTDESDQGSQEGVRMTTFKTNRDKESEL